MCMQDDKDNYEYLLKMERDAAAQHQRYRAEAEQMRLDYERGRATELRALEAADMKLLELMEPTDKELAEVISWPFCVKEF